MGRSWTYSRDSDEISQGPSRFTRERSGLGSICTASPGLWSPLAEPLAPQCMIIDSNV
jgi:hypothetical protein